jgi:hypothetical protein
MGNLDLDLVEDPSPGEIGDYAEITDPKGAQVLVCRSPS